MKQEARRLQALWSLSDFPKDISVQAVADLIRQAPDPETACRVVTSQIPHASDVLDRKWREVIHESWLVHHPHVAEHLPIPLISSDVEQTIAFRDAHALLQALAKKPVSIVTENNDRVVALEDIRRLIEVMPSLQGRYIPDIENEWSCIPLRRMRAALFALRLVRMYGGKLTIVRSRYERFLQLPPTQQYYALWHVDVYHVDWAEFVPTLAPYIRVIQSYLPLVWDIVRDIEAGDRENIHDLTREILSVFVPLWQHEGMLVIRDKRTFLDVYEQAALPAVLERLLIGDIFSRYGLLYAGVSLVASDVSRTLLLDRGNFAWTQLGEAILRAEYEEHTPCGIELLS